jgi:hypothetical protein
MPDGECAVALAAIVLAVLLHALLVLPILVLVSHIAAIAPLFRVAAAPLSAPPRS